MNTKYPKYYYSYDDEPYGDTREWTPLYARTCKKAIQEFEAIADEPQLAYIGVQHKDAPYIWTLLVRPMDQTESSEPLWVSFDGEYLSTL